MRKFLSSVLILFAIAQTACFAETNTKTRFNKKLFSSQKEKTPINNDEMTTSKKAVLYYSENDIKRAFDTLTSIKDEDKSSQDWLLLGNLFQDKGKNSDAVFMYRRAIMTDEKNYKAYYNMANIFLDENKYNLAIQNFRKCNRLNNKFPYGYYNLGCAYVQAGELSKAKMAFLKAIELKNTEPDFHYNLALTYKKLGKEKQAKQYLDFYNKLKAENN